MGASESSCSDRRLAARTGAAGEQVACCAYFRTLASILALCAQACGQSESCSKSEQHVCQTVSDSQKHVLQVASDGEGTNRLSAVGNQRRLSKPRKLDSNRLRDTRACPPGKTHSWLVSPEWKRNPSQVVPAGFLYDGGIARVGGPGVLTSDSPDRPGPPEPRFRPAVPAPDSTSPESHAADEPAGDPNSHARVIISGDGGLISLVVRDTPVNSILELVAQQYGLNVVAGENVTGNVSVTLTDVDLADALNAILTVNGYTWVREKNILLVTRVSAGTSVAPHIQGRQMRVFPLSYVSAIDVDVVVKGLLSPIGQSFITESDPLDKRRTQEQLVVEDLPEYLGRVEQYVCQVDRPPKQVLIEAHVLHVSLKDDTRHGVDLQRLLARIDNTRVTIRTTGFTEATANPAFFLGIDGTDLDMLIEALTTTTDAKTLASPKVLVLNGQEAHFQIGERLGFHVTTTTQTSTMQQVNFLDVGVVLKVTPVISDDGQILMTVKPEVSSGRINPANGLPEEETTEVETTVMLADGQAMVIGGLIEETDLEVQSKVPLVGDFWLIGRLFQRRKVVRERNEIIIALIPRVVPYQPNYQGREFAEAARATSPLLHGPLDRIDRRPLEPELPDAIKDPRSVEFSRAPHFFENLRETYPHPLKYYFPSVGEKEPWIRTDPWKTYAVGETLLDSTFPSSRQYGGEHSEDLLPDDQPGATRAPVYDE